jgi:mRNA-degrading endonuclease toxin of MazEF toxin-antitoxin module
MKRGEVWWVDLPAPAGRCPAVLLSRDAAYRVRASITVALVSAPFEIFPLKLSWIEVTACRPVAWSILTTSRLCRKF